MPEIIRAQTRLNCLGIDLVHPVDKMPEGYYPYLSNARVVSEGRIDSRPGFTQFSGPALSNYHSIRRLNDEDLSEAPSGYIYVAGNGTTLEAGVESALTTVDTGYSGDPLSLLTFRPDASPESWMYVYDGNKQSKVNPGGTVRDIGVAPPPGPVEATYGTPAIATIDDGQAVTVGGNQWLTIGDVIGGGIPALPATLINRELTPTGGSVTSTINQIVYDSGSVGWCCMNVVTSDTSVDNEPIWAGPRMKVILGTGGGAETCLLREIHPKIPDTTLAGIYYDPGSSGLCTAVLASSPATLARNSLIAIGSEAVRVLSLSLSPDGSTYSIRCRTTVGHVAGETVTGLTSWYVFTINTHTAGEAVSTNCLAAVGAAFGNNYAEMIRLANIDASTANGRPISLANDYMHLSFLASNAPAIVAMEIGIDIDVATSTLNVPPASDTDAFSNNYILWTLAPEQIFGPGGPPSGAPAGLVWNEIVVKLSEGVRYGNDPTRTLASIRALKIKLYTSSVVTQFFFDWWYVFGTYGPEIQTSDPAGYLYASANRDSTTGAASVIGPPTRYELNPLREQVLVTPLTSTEVGVDSLDVYRQGGTLSNPTYDGTVANNPGSPNVFLDNQPDTSIQSSPQADLTLIQPWPVVDLPWSGTCNVVGTRVINTGGTSFNVKLLSGQVILINGIAYQVYGQPDNSALLNLFTSGGVLTGATFQVQSPTLGAQPMPFAFGPLEGPFAPVAFALGDPRSPGTLYYSNSANLDGASDKNTLEICGPGEPLISGATWNGIVIVGSRENIYLVRYTYQQTPLFQFQRLPSPSGMWSRWACCAGQDGVYFLGRDGTYRATDGGVERVASPDPRHDPLYPLFPHDGQPGAGTPDMAAVDMSQLAALRLSAADNDIYFDYLSVGS